MESLGTECGFEMSDLGHLFDAISLTEGEAVQTSGVPIKNDV